MSVSIISYPKKIVNSDSAQVSKWSAVHQPIVFQMARRDYIVHHISNNGSGNLKLDLTASSDIAVGDIVYVNTNGIVGNLQAITGTTGSVVILGYGYTGAGAIGTGYVNSLTTRKNYYVETAVLGINTLTNTYYQLGTLISKPTSEGNCNVDCHEHLKSLVGYKDQFAYDVINKRDINLGKGFNIQYREVWRGHTGSYSTITTATLFYYTNGAKQIQNIYGSNMGDYVPFSNTNTTEPKAKFLCNGRPTYFPGFPFDLTFIFSDAIAGLAIYKHEKSYDVNRTSLGENAYALDSTQTQAPNRMMLQEGYASSVSTVDVWLEAGDSICAGYTVDDYVAAGYTTLDCGIVTPVVPIDLGDTERP